MKSFIPRCTWAAMALFAATTVLTGLTSCAEKDLPAIVTPESKMKQDLVGSWIAEYSQTGMVAMANGHKRNAVSAVQTLTFNEDGTGTCTKYICDAAGEPFSCFGDTNSPNGRFHYTVGKDSVITITRDGDGNASNPKTWQLHFGTNGLKGTDGTTDYEMFSATEGWKAYIGRLEKVYNKKFRGKLQASGRDTTFLTDWETYTDIEINGMQQIGNQFLPWAGWADCDIPDAIRFDIKKKNGWEMAFCVLNDSRAGKTRFFALYNRYTGTLRVFHYVLDAHDYGKEMAYRFIADGDANQPRYAFYNSMEYAIPICHKYNVSSTFKRDIILTSPTNINYKPFETMFTAFTRQTDCQAVTQGWHCVDFELSGYTEQGVNWTQGLNDRGTVVSITPATQSVSEALLTGAITGNLKGIFAEPKYKQYTSGSATYSKIAKTVSTFAGGYNTVLGNINSAYGMANACRGLREAHYGGTMDYQNSQILWASCGALNGVSCLMNAADIWFGEHVDSTVLESPGTLTMSIDAHVDLSGTISNWKAIGEAGVRITPELLDDTKKIKEGQNDTVWVGAGCFGLAEDPVIYISEEDLLSTSPSIAISKVGNHYQAPSFRKDSVRLVSFLDPSTVKVCVNTDVYHGIDSVQLIINYGAITQRSVGHTDGYREMLMLDKRPTFSITPKSGNKLTTTTIPKLTIMPKSTVIKNDYYTKLAPDSVKLDYQTITSFDSLAYLPLYGHFETEYGKRFVMNPQVFVPYDLTKNSSIVYPVTIPDFVVTVSVLLKCHEFPGGVAFSKPYIPKIKLIKHADLADFYDKLKEYSDKSFNQQAVGTLYNDPEIPVYDHTGCVLLDKTLDILEKCIE